MGGLEAAVTLTTAAENVGTGRTAPHQDSSLPNTSSPSKGAELGRAAHRVRELRGDGKQGRHSSRRESAVPRDRRPLGAAVSGWDWGRTHHWRPEGQTRDGEAAGAPPVSSPGPWAPICTVVLMPVALLCPVTPTSRPWKHWPCGECPQGLRVAQGGTCE